jgi:hypothetical protein
MLQQISQQLNCTHNDCSQHRPRHGASDPIYREYLFVRCIQSGLLSILFLLSFVRSYLLNLRHLVFDVAGHRGVRSIYCTELCPARRPTKSSGVMSSALRDLVNLVSPVPVDLVDVVGAACATAAADKLLSSTDPGL